MIVDQLKTIYTAVYEAEGNVTADQVALETGLDLDLVREGLGKLEAIDLVEDATPIEDQRFRALQ